MHDYVANSSTITYRLEGELVNKATGFGIADLRVEVFDSEGLCVDLVAHVKSDEQGHFLVEFDDKYLDSLFCGRIPILGFRVYIFSTSPTPVCEKFADPAETWTPSPETKRIRIPLDMAASRTNTWFAYAKVRGRVTDAQGSPLEGYIVEAYSKTATGEVQLVAYGSGSVALDFVATDSNGWYRIQYSLLQVATSGRVRPNLIVKAFAPEDDEDPIAWTEEICHAPPTVIANLIQNNARYRGTAEVDRVASQITSVIGETEPIGDLTEGQITHIACTTGGDRSLIEMYVKATQIAAELGTVPAGVVYVLLRQGLPQSRRGLLAQRPAVLRQFLERAVAINLVNDAPEISTIITAMVAAFTEVSVDLALEAREGGGTGLGDVIALALEEPADQRLFASTFIEMKEIVEDGEITHPDTIEQFWDDIDDAEFTADPSPDINKLKRVMQWGALTRYHAPLVAKLELLWVSEAWTSVSDVAIYDEDDWYTILTADTVPIGAPPDVPNTGEGRNRNYARILERTVETAFTTAVIAARITAEADEDDGDLITFFENEDNAEFDFAKTRVATYLAANTGAMTGVSNVPATTRQLKGLERIFRLTRRYPELKVLREAGLDSAHKIHRLGRSRFLAQHGAALGAENAARIFGRACWVASTASALYAKYGAQFNGVPIFTLPDLVTSASAPQDVIADWATLFGSADACACEHCRSVYGPAAYLVDLFEFLQRQDSTVETSASVPLAKRYFSARDVLLGYFGTDAEEPLARRSDLAHILLSCENTNTTLPYIDLVNEILEFAVANLVDDPDHAWPENIQTVEDAANLLAEPQIIDPEVRLVAYTELANAVHPFHLPFHVWDAEARVYLEHLGVTRYSLLETLLLAKKSPAAGTTDLVARERLGLSLQARDVLVGETISGLSLNDYWGMPDGENWWISVTAPPIFYEGLDSVKKFLPQSGLSFDELRELLATEFLDGDVALDPAEGCDIDAKSLTGLTETILGRIHRFLRLRQRAGLTITETDWIIKAFGATNIDAALLRNVADTLALQKELEAPLAVVLSLWSPMGIRTYEGQTSLYEQLFLTRFNKQLSDPDQFAAILTLIDPGESDKTVLELALGVMAGLRIKLDELALLMVPEVSQAAMGLPNVVPTAAKLSLANLSRLHRIVAFARALRMSTREYLILRELSGMNVLTGDVMTPSPDAAAPSDTRAFVALVNKLRAAGFPIAEIHYLVRHVELAPAKVGIAADTVERIVQQLEAAALEIDTLERAQDEPDEGYTAAVRARVDEAVIQKFAAELKVSVDIVGHLLAHAMTASGSSNDALTDFYPADPPVEPPAAQIPVSAANRSKTVVRLSKAVMLVKRLKFDVQQLQWLYPVTVGSSWLNLDDLPVEQVNSAATYQPIFADLVRLVEFAAVRELLPKRGEDLVAILTFAKQVLDASTTPDAEDFYAQIASRTDLGFKGADIEALADAHFGYHVKPEVGEEFDFGDEIALGKVLRALKMLHSLGATVAQGIAWSNIDGVLPGAQDIAVQIKCADRAKYDEKQWPTVVRPIRDKLREMQRDALVGYLISADDDVNEPNDLFGKLLIDVEMSACQLTSRIKQAISSVQTFVQRSFLGLESDVKLSEDAAHEWEWLKSYRVWEANRKVFLYPENWIEPELRDDKTPLFKAMESTLNQGEIDAEAAERAYVGYLEELHGIARLDIAAVCHEQENDDDCARVNTVHVIGRTHALPHRYFYRKRVGGVRWTPWEKIDVEIQGDHLLATIWNRRLYLFWPVFEQGANENNATAIQHLRLAWTYRHTDGFTGPFMSGDDAATVSNGKDAQLSLSLTTSIDEGRLSVNILRSSGSKYYRKDSFLLNPCTGQMELISRPWMYLFPFSAWLPWAASPKAMRLVEVADEQKAEPLEENNYLELPPENTKHLLEQTPGQFSILIDRVHTNVVLSSEPRSEFFYLDNTRTFFVERQSRQFSKWVSPGDAYPNMPAAVGENFIDGLEPEVLDWLVKPVLDLNVEYDVESLYRFRAFYHPYVCEFIRRLGRDGIDGVLRWSTGSETAVQLLAKTDVDDEYEPTKYVYDPFPIENVDFSFGGAYSQYNWELFFHAPFLIATRLTKNSRFADADKWYRYIFDPTGGAPGEGPERFWNVRPFRENINLASIQEQLDTLADGNPQAQELQALFDLGADTDGAAGIAAQIAQWRDNPFNPHLIARLRIVAYQKSVVMKYVGNLLAWGDSLFRRDTMESINEATQLYILASQILGPRPRLVKTDDIEPLTYADLVADDETPNPVVEIEGIVPRPPIRDVCCGGEPAPTFYTPHFCVPHNDKMLSLWDTVEDRLLKVRCCMNIDGVVRQLPLFEAPLDPALLVKATAAGLNLGDVLAQASIPLPKYRFSVLLPKAMEFAGSVVSMGNALLSALEKRDGETLSKLRSTQEIDMLTRVRDVRRRQIDEARETLEGLKRSWAVIEERRRFYTEIDDRIDEEKAQKDATVQAANQTYHAQSSQYMASVLRLFPQIDIGTTNVSSEFGGVQLGSAAEAIAQLFSMEASRLGTNASLAGTEAGYKRRAAEWELQKNLAERELLQIDRQIAAAEIRLAIAQSELKNHDQSLKNAKEVDDFLRTKYSREELYEWLVTQIKGVYFQAYKVAFDMAMRAQKAFQFELALPDETYLSPAYWDSTTDGLLAGERLQHDLRRMEAAYLELNKREFELTKHVSLAEVDPVKLLKLRETGTCDVALPEAIFDMDWPGHYMRRIKSVSVSIPVVNAPYAGVNCKLSLAHSSVRKTDTLLTGDVYARATPDDSDRFDDDRTPLQNVVTSNAQQDSGLFELVFRDERYLPFEGAGAESEWQITLDRKTNRFNPTDAKDVILHIRYTARESGNSTFKEKAEEALDNSGPVGYRLFSAKADFPGEWAVFTDVGEGATSQNLALPFAKKHFQKLRDENTLKITSVQVFAKRPGGGTGNMSGVSLTPPYLPPAEPDPETKTLMNSSEYGKLVSAEFNDGTSYTVTIYDETSASFAPWTLTVPASEVPLDDIWIVCTYQKGT